MRISCRHGYFIFEEERPGDVSRFLTIYSGLNIVSMGNQFTFAKLAAAPNYSIVGNPYLGTVATKTICSEPPEVMRANGLIYNYNTDKLVPLISISQRAVLAEGANYYLSDGLILPGSITDDGKRVTDYAAWYLSDVQQFRYSEVTVV